MADHGYIGLRFFRIMLSNFSCKLSLPKDLANDLSREGNSDKASIVKRNGKVWLVDLLVEQEKMFMGGEGWQEFVQANHIELGYLLILRYRGNFVFSFRVFDPSSCEHSCSSSAAASASAQKTKGKMIASSSSRLIPERGLKKKNKNLKFAPRNEYFETTLKTWNFSHGFVLIPAAFKKSIGLSAEHKESSIRDLKGEWWHIGLLHLQNFRVSQICRGWRGLACANELKVGDRVVFEFVSLEGKNKVLQLKMYKL